ANDVQPAVTYEALKLRRECCGCLVVAAIFRVWQPCVWIARNVLATQLAERSNVIRHELGTCRAVHSERQGFRVSERRPHGFDRLAREHRPILLDGDGNDEWDFGADFL